MKILQTSVSNTFRDALTNWADELHAKAHSALFHIYVPYNMENGAQRLDEIRFMIQKLFPGCPMVGCSATGELLNGKLCNSEIVVTMMLFESPDTKVKVMPYYEHRANMDAESLLHHIADMPDLQGIEILTAAEYERLESTGGVLDQLPENIEIFGGVAVGDNTHRAYVFCEDHPLSTDGTVIVFYQGADLHLFAHRMFGWKAIGYPLEVTRSEKNIVYELDHKPAYDVYNHYLHIEKDSNFFYEALEFPWEVDGENGSYIRHAKSVNSDGSIVMSSNIPQGSKIRISYGDPRRMVDHTIRAGVAIQEFGPQILFLVNCMGRMLFWGDRLNEEIFALSKRLPVTGFSALGEIMRTNSTTLLHNLSIVAVAMREGSIQQIPPLDYDQISIKKTLPVTARLAIFINTITEELMEKNQQLNDMLFQANHDFLTSLLNRGAIERLIYSAKTNEDIGPNQNWFLIMFDLDDFKIINDTYGHSEGDKVLYDLSHYLIPLVEENPRLDAGRWGGEEFMIFGYGYTDNEILQLAESLRNSVKKPDVMRRPITISIGITKHQQGEPENATIIRADKLLYRAKGQGKDCICSDLK